MSTRWNGSFGIGSPRTSHSGATPRSAGRGSTGNSTPTSTRSAKGSARRQGGEGAKAGQMLQERLEQLHNVRVQLEKLAKKHREEEVALATAMSNIILDDNTQSNRSRQELLVLVEERNRAIQMLDVFRKEGNDIVTRMHEALQQSHRQNDELAKQLRRVADENTALRTRLASCGVSDADIEPSTSGPGGVSADERIAQYEMLLSEADEMMTALRAQNEQLKAHIASGAVHHSTRSSSLSASPAPTDPDQVERLKRLVETLRDDLKREKDARLEAEEFSSRLMVEHRKSVQLLEKRIHWQEASTGGGSSSPRGPSTLGTPRTARGVVNPVRPTITNGAVREVVLSPEPESNASASVVNPPLAAVQAGASSSGSLTPGTTPRPGESDSLRRSRSNSRTSGTPNVRRTASDVREQVPSPRSSHMTSPTNSSVPDDTVIASAKFDHDTAMMELQSLEAQLREVAAAFGEDS